MRIIARRTLREFVDSLAGHRDQSAVKAALDPWFAEVKRARWRNTADVKRLYATAGIVTAERIVFNVKGNCLPLGPVGRGGRGGRFRMGDEVADQVQMALAIGPNTLQSRYCSRR
jgi:mRNA-degrading endonuclease HigB of HigAB toxin-antitoxin module